MAGWVDYSGISRDELHHLIILGATTLVVLAANILGISSGISGFLPQLFNIPVILAAYWYPRYGIYFAVLLSALYLGISQLLLPFSQMEFALAAGRAAVFILVGAVISWLATNLRKQEELYQGVFEHSLAMTFIAKVTDEDGLIEEVNSSAAKTFDPSHWIPHGTPLSQFWPDAEARKKFFATLQEKGTIRNHEATFVTHSGKTLDILVSGTRLTGDIAILIAQDVSEQKRKDEALSAANEKLNRLGSLTRHDVLNAMTALLGEIDLGSMQYEGKPEYAVFERLDVAAQRVRRRIEMSRDYQDLGAKPADWQNVQEILETGGSRVKFGDIRFHPWAERLEIFADPLVRGAFLHLLENTVTHAKGATHLIVTYSLRDSGCDLYFRDNGVGIPAEKKARLFVHKSGREDGLGLFLVKEILGVTGITITEDGEPGKGVLFTVHLPNDKFRVI